MPSSISRANQPVGSSALREPGAQGLAQALNRLNALSAKPELSSAQAQELDQLKGNVVALGLPRLGQLKQKDELSSAEAEEYSRLRGTVVMSGLDHLAHLSKRGELSSAEAAELPTLKRELRTYGQEMVSDLRGRELSSGEAKDLARLQADLPRLTGGGWAAR